MLKTIRGKLLVSFSILILLTLLIGGIGINTARIINNNYTGLLEDDVEQVNHLENVMILQGQIVAGIRGFLLYEDDAYIETVDNEQQQLHDILTTLQTMVHKEYEPAVQTILDAATLYTTNSDQILTNLTNEARLNEVLAIGTEANEKLLSETLALKDQIEADLAEHNNELNAITTKSLWFIAGALVVTLLASLVITYVANRGISPPVIATTRTIEEMAKGNLNIAPLDVKAEGELGAMATAVNTLLQTWNSVVRKMEHSATELAAQSEELSASAEQSLASSEMVAQAAEQNMTTSETQANYILQSIDSLHEVGEGIDQIAESNEEMLQAATTMRSLVHEGVDVVHEVSTHMTAIDTTIGESTSIMEVMAKRAVEIEEVSALITGISEQTNLLALNAAIEAARAGENGKGFAVVADEVRKLAEESKQSAARIETMIQDVRQAAEQAVQSIQTGQATVAEGLNRSAASRDVFTTIEQSVDDVNGRVETVSAAVQQIQAMASEVLRSTNQLQDLAQQSANTAQDTGAATEQQLAAMQQISASTQSLANVAQDLQDEVTQFQLR
ncbi:MAG TPA: methyl-accepting chemotaxis protein [Metalysinibacillus jejuensis]|uniref:Methyl-accepting chemotaxis protein n=1 Tax=Metalysinibacillus jejuensis TaxID=914327 RepID=A0A921NBL4_9BACL|nr:methyl-accepting chemotaxis protein [Metalysinibacillus jejuensis]